MARKERSALADTGDGGTNGEQGVASVSVVIVDDNEDMRSLVRLLCDLDGVIEVLGEATSAAAGVATWRRYKPDVVILDYRMEDASGLDAAREILAEDPGAVIVMFSAFLSDATTAEAEAIGVKACVSKDDLRRLTDLVVSFGREH
jgi:DNA-binding NarL/FixJ family response regulator